MIPYFSWTSRNWGKIEHNNWGDELAHNFLSWITDEYLVAANFFCNPRIASLKKYLSEPTSFIIGSVIHYCSTEDSIVWGVGSRDGEVPDLGLDIRAVRGPLTRKAFLAKGIPCPEVFGDSALLLPYYYRPKVEKRYRLGIVPHFYDSHDDVIMKYATEPDVLVINMYDYERWTDIVDKINMCEHVISTGLHGLVTAQAYGVPYCWGEIHGPNGGEEALRFKFYDFFASLSKTSMIPYELENCPSVDDIINYINANYTECHFSVKPLVNACPFTLKEPLSPFE